MRTISCTLAQDSFLNQDEAGVDCGGSCPILCPSVSPMLCVASNGTIIFCPSPSPTQSFSRSPVYTTPTDFLPYYVSGGAVAAVLLVASLLLWRRTLQQKLKRERGMPSGELDMVGGHPDDVLRIQQLTASPASVVGKL